MQYIVEMELMKKKEIDNMTKTFGFLSKIIEFFKKIFKLNNHNLLSETSSENQQSTIEKQKFIQDLRQSNNVENNESEKNITMFFYKQLRLGNIDPKYIPAQYLEKISVLLKEEKKIKQKEINRINEEISQNEQKLKKYSQDNKL